MDPRVWPLHFQGGKTELFSFVFFIHCMIRKYSRLICECDTDPEQLLCSGKPDNAYLALELLQTVPGVSPWCWWDLGILEPSPHAQSWDRPDGICRMRQDVKDQ